MERLVFYVQQLQQQLQRTVQERSRADQAEKEKAQLLERLIAKGIDPDEFMRALS